MKTVQHVYRKRHISLLNLLLKWTVVPAISLGIATLTQAGPQIFNVRQYGATGDGTTLDTTAIQNALDTCSTSGGGILHFPAGTYLSQPLLLRSFITLQLDDGAKLIATDTTRDFIKPKGSSPASWTGFVYGKDLTNVTITGSGTIDGAGAQWWNKLDNKNDTQSRPRMIVLINCRNVKVQGMTLQDSPSFHLALVDCEDALIDGVTFKAPADSPNTDAVDPATSRRVTIANCTFDTGGEGVVIKSGKPVAGHRCASENITVTNCTFRHGRGFSIGSETIGGVSNVAVKNCTFQDTAYGIHLKSSRSKGGIVEDIVCEDIIMSNVKTPVAISCYNQGVPTNDTAQAVMMGTPIFRNIQFKNITATKANVGGLMVGLPESEIKDVTWDNVQINSKTTGLKIRNARGIKFNNSRVSPAQGPPVISEGNTDINNAGQ